MRSIPNHPHLGRLAALFGILILVAACTEAGSSDVRSSVPTGSLTVPTSAGPSDSSSGGDGYTRGDYGTAASPSAAASAASSGAETYVVDAASGAVGAYLTGEDGRTLYTFKPDSANTSTCTGDCAGAWPPFVVTAGDTITAGSGVSGTLATFVRPDGSLQLAYNGAPLYYFANDAKAGDTNGQGVGGKWFVAAP